jgi:hypothetical protein
MALAPLIGSGLGAIFGGGKSDQEKWSEKQSRDLYAQLMPLFQQSVQQTQQRNTQMQPLYDAVLRMVGGGLPSWAGLDLNMLARPQAPAQPEPRRWFQGLAPQQKQGGR